LMMEAVIASEMSDSIYQTTRRNILEGSYLHLVAVRTWKRSLAFYFLSFPDIIYYSRIISFNCCIFENLFTIIIFAFEIDSTVEVMCTSILICLNQFIENALLFRDIA
jgi:hypothetical protein